MAIDFTLTTEQQEIQAAARDFAQNVLAPVTPKIDEEPDPLKGCQIAKPAYAEACKRGIAFSMLPKEYGGGGMSNVDFIIAAEEIQAVDPGFGTAVLVNGLGLMPVWYYGTEEQKERFIGGATSDTSGEFIVGYAASEPAGSPGGTANFDAPGHRRRRHGRDRDARRRRLRHQRPQVLAVQRRRLGQPGREPEPRGRAAPTRPRAAPRDCRRSSSSAARRGHLQLDQHDRAPHGAELRDHLRQRAGAGGEPGRGHEGQRRPADQPQLRLVGPGRRDRRGRGRPRGLRGGARVGQDLHRRRPEADHPLPVPGLRARRRRREDRGRPLLLLEDARTTSTSTTTTAR